MGAKVTIYDISERVGVSPSTVSRALNGGGRISAETRRKIAAVAEELGYRPNNAARNLRTGRANAVAFITDNLSSPLVSAMAAGAEGWLRDQGWTLFVADGGASFRDAEAFLSVFDESQLAGIMLAGSWIHVFDDSWVPQMPAVCLFCFPASGRHPTILTNDFEGAYAATTHLIERGYERIALVNGPSFWYASQERLRGFRQALEDAGRVFDPKVVRYGDWKPESGYRETADLLRTVCPDGIFVANDYMAVGALRAADEQSIAVPRELGIIGFDNREVTQITRPKLSSVVLPMHEVGRRGAERLFELVHSEKSLKSGPANSRNDPLLVSCPLVVRQTTDDRVQTDDKEFPFF